MPPLAITQLKKVYSFMSSKAWLIEIQSIQIKPQIHPNSDVIHLQQQGFFQKRLTITFQRLTLSEITKKSHAIEVRSCKKISHKILKPSRFPHQERDFCTLRVSSWYHFSWIARDFIGCMMSVFCCVMGV